jgi:hypothetical protein
MSNHSPARSPLWQFGLIRFVFFVIVWCGAMYVFRAKDQPFNVEHTITLAVLGGLLFGGARAWMEMRRRQSEDAENS